MPKQAVGARRNGDKRVEFRIVHVTSCKVVSVFFWLLISAVSTGDGDYRVERAQFTFCVVRLLKEIKRQQNFGDGANDYVFITRRKM